MTEAAQPIIGRGKHLLDQLLRMAHTRLELLSLELEQERLNVTRELRLAAICVVCAWLAGFTLVLWVALAFPPDVRFIVLGALFGAFALATLLAWLVLRRLTARRTPLFSRLVAQLRLDRASLGAEPP
jgi:uncharacterized membrane protein YqjE